MVRNVMIGRKEVVMQMRKFGCGLVLEYSHRFPSHLHAAFSANEHRLPVKPTPQAQLSVKLCVHLTTVKLP